ncbi:MAG: FAD-binding protein, partial [Alphaproteobacteria bacterium]|nr:FAD-binding protein [Alphaproteobacteria bacterium]
MSESYLPTEEKDLVALIAWAAAEGKRVELMGGGTKRGLGHAVAADLVVNLRAFAGVRNYEPEELVVSAGAGTNLAEIEAVLRQSGQRLAFEPGEWAPLWGGAAGKQTLGGALAAAVSGPRRIKDGAARDHILGLRAVSGRGEAFKAGGRVVKNVTGFDLSKLAVGSFGTLAALTEVTLKVMPLPEKTRTLLVLGLDDEAAIRLLCRAAGSSHEVSGLAHLPRGIAARSAVGYVKNAGAAVTALRVEGPAPSVAVRLEALKVMAKGLGALEELHGTNSAAFWQEVASASAFAGEIRPLWRLSVPPAEGPEVVAGIRAACPAAEAYYDWSGGLIWLALPETEDAGAGLVRATVNGHATLMRASHALRAKVAVFQPEPPA